MASLVLYLAADPAPIDWRFAMPGSLIALCAIALLFATHRALDGNFSTTIDVGKERSLVTSGPYRHVRHPMYVAYLMFFLGLLAVSKNLVFGLSGAAIILSLMILRIRYEEESLLERFGEEYARYAASVPRFFPRMNGDGK
ncbi:MAG: isoprenylcysteine carboxyl methyltransferase [Spirochaetes bacterium]|nr:MAG: isoprenylcysteine carboxyl methyltransferase [Spirochaetota bacterium]